MILYTNLVCRKKLFQIESQPSKLEGAWKSFTCQFRFVLSGFCFWICCAKNKISHSSSFDITRSTFVNFYFCIIKLIRFLWDFILLHSLKLISLKGLIKAYFSQRALKLISLKGLSLFLLFLLKLISLFKAYFSQISKFLTLILIWIGFVLDHETMRTKLMLKA